MANLVSGVSANVTMDIGFYNSSIGGCTAGVGSWKKQRMAAKAPGTKLTRDRREEYENGMVCLPACLLVYLLVLLDPVRVVSHPHHCIASHRTSPWCWTRMQR